MLKDEQTLEEGAVDRLVCLFKSKKYIQDKAFKKLIVFKGFRKAKPGSLFPNLYIWQIMLKGKFRDDVFHLYRRNILHMQAICITPLYFRHFPAHFPQMLPARGYPRPSGFFFCEAMYRRETPSIILLITLPRLLPYTSTA
jgi:hypothetical protein